MTEWKISPAPVGYREAMAVMEARAGAVRAAAAPELVWLLEHPPLYTAGTSAVPEEMLEAGGLPVIQTGRGGRHTYHGPGQRVAYVVLDVGRRGSDVRRFVWSLEEWVIRALGELGVAGERRDGRPGVWVVRRGGREEKIAALGLRIRHWVATHGVAVNVDPDLARFAGVVPCGIRGHGVTSLRALGCRGGREELDAALARHFAGSLGIEQTSACPKAVVAT